MPWWGVLLVVLFCDWSAMAILGVHLTRRATKAVEEGVEGVKLHLFSMVPLLLEQYRISVQTKADSQAREVEDATREGVEQGSHRP